jgi:hypothetical protein
MDLALLTALVVKHFICDFTRIQTPGMYLHKGTYGHPGGIAHAFVHVVASLVVLLLFSSIYAGNYMFFGIIGLLMFEGAVHYHMDWFKMWWNREKGYKADTHPEFWFWLGVDQMVHYLTYIVMVLAWT